MDGGMIRYVGKTIRNLNRRLIAHLCESRNGAKNHRADWIRSLTAVGKLPIIKAIRLVNGDGCKEEIRMIATLRAKGVKLVNGTDGGDGASFAHSVSQSARDKISKSMVGNKRFLGRTHSAETRLKMSLAQKGRILTDEHRRNLSDALKGRVGRVFTDDMRLQMSIACKGRIHLEEHRKKISIGLKRYFSTMRRSHQ